LTLRQSTTPIQKLCGSKSFKDSLKHRYPDHKSLRLPLGTISIFKIENPSDHRPASTIIIIKRTSTLGRDLEHSKAHGQTHHRGMGKLFGLHSEVTRDGRQVHHPEFYYRLSRAVRSHIDAKTGGFSRQGHDDEQFRLEPTRSTTFKVWLKLKARGEVKFVLSAIIFYISPLPSVIMDLEKSEGPEKTTRGG
jgi:hypothetical protein